MSKMNINSNVFDLCVPQDKWEADSTHSECTNCKKVWNLKKDKLKQRNSRVPQFQFLSFFFIFGA